jgi:hypothetical protein
LPTPIPTLTPNPTPNSTPNPTTVAATYVFKLQSEPKPVLEKVTYAAAPNARRTVSKKLALCPILLRNAREQRCLDEKQKRKDQYMLKTRKKGDAQHSSLCSDDSREFEPVQMGGYMDSPDSVKLFNSLDEMMQAAQSELTYDPSNLD